ncbi:MAG: AraC family transcriptional regulator, partial [Comamonadaceae bacterium]
MDAYFRWNQANLGGIMRIAVYAFDDITMFHLAAPLMVFGEV